MKTYNPKPLDTSDVNLPLELADLIEMMAENVHEVWALNRIIKDGPTEQSVMTN